MESRFGTNGDVNLGVDINGLFKKTMTKKNTGQSLSINLKISIFTPAMSEFSRYKFATKLSKHKNMVNSRHQMENILGVTAKLSRSGYSIIVCPKNV